MEAAFCLSHLPSILSLPPKSSHVNGLFTSNRTSLSYSSPTTTKQQSLSCKTNYKQHLSCFRHSFTGVPPRKYVFHPTPMCAFDDGRVPAAKKDKGIGDKKKQGIIVGSAARVVLACTLLGIIMCSNGRLIQAKAYNIPGFQNKQTTTLPRPDEEIKMLKSEYKETCKKECQDNKTFQNEMLRAERLIRKVSASKPIDVLARIANTKDDRLCHLNWQGEDIHHHYEWIFFLLAYNFFVYHPGKYKEALDCLSSYKGPEDVTIVDSVDIRIYLYKTFLYMMTGDENKAMTWGEALIDNFDKNQAKTWGKAGKKHCLKRLIYLLNDKR